MPLTSLLVADDQEKLPTGQCRPRVPPSPINLRGDAYLNLQKVLDHAQVRDYSEIRVICVRWGVGLFLGYGCGPFLGMSEKQAREAAAVATAHFFFVLMCVCVISSAELQSIYPPVPRVREWVVPGLLGVFTLQHVIRCCQVVFVFNPQEPLPCGSLVARRSARPCVVLQIDPSVVCCHSTSLLS